MAAITGTAGAAEVLTLDQCIAAALANHPDLMAKASAIDSSRATIGQAVSNQRPQASIYSGYSRSGGSDVSDGSNYDTGVTVSQLLSDWGVSRLSIQKARQNTAAASADYFEQLDQVINDVRSAYYSLNSATRQNKIARSSYADYEKRLSWAKTYYQVGTKAKIEVTTAESDLASSKLTVVKTDAAAEQAKADLAAAMGSPGDEINSVKDELAFKDWNITVDDAVDRAIANRPELLAKQKRVEAAKSEVGIQEKGLSPNLSASGGYGFGGSSYFDSDEWNAKLSISVPVIDGGLTKSKVEQAKANLRTTEAEFASMSNSVVQEVRKAWQAMRQAKEALTSSIAAEKSAKESYLLAEGRYKAGVGDKLEISNAIQSYSTAQTNTVLSLYTSRTASLALEKAIGGMNGAMNGVAGGLK